MSSGTSPRRNVLAGLTRRCCHKALSGSASAGFIRPGRTHHDFILRTSPAESSALISKRIIPTIWNFVAPNSSRKKIPASFRLIQATCTNPHLEPHTFELRSLVDILLSSLPQTADSYAALSRPSITLLRSDTTNVSTYGFTPSQMELRKGRVAGFIHFHITTDPTEDHIPPSRNRIETKNHL